MFCFSKCSMGPPRFYRFKGLIPRFIGRDVGIFRGVNLIYL